NSRFLAEFSSFRSPSSGHQISRISSIISSIFCPTSLTVIQTMGARIADQIDQMSPESSQDYRT
ncbi:unnamed protein product, partial [Prunus brigantina]